MEPFIFGQHSHQTQTAFNTSLNHMCPLIHFVARHLCRRDRCCLVLTYGNLTPTWDQTRQGPDLRFQLDPPHHCLTRIMEFQWISSTLKGMDHWWWFQLMVYDATICWICSYWIKAAQPRVDVAKHCKTMQNLSFGPGRTLIYSVIRSHGGSFACQIRFMLLPSTCLKHLRTVKMEASNLSALPHQTLCGGTNCVAKASALLSRVVPA